MPAAELTKAIAAWSSRYEDDVVIDDRHAEARGLSWRVEADGIFVAVVRCAPVDAGAFMAAVDSAVMRHSQRERADDEGWPSLAQQRVDALLDLLVGGGSQVETEVVLHVRGDGATLDDGTPITESSVVRALPAAFVRALVHDAERRPINASSRQRHPTTRQRRLVKERDRSCVDCGGVELLEFDHVPDYADSGRTVVEELELRCGPCHRFRHARPARYRV